MDRIEECGGMDEGGMMPPMGGHEGSPVSMNVSLNASGKDHVADLIDMMKNAGLKQAEPVSAKMLAPRIDMERLRGIVDGPDMEADELYADAAEECKYCGGDCPNDEEHACDGYLGDIDGLYADELEEYENEPEEEYSDMKTMTKDLSGGINREKKAYAKAQDGDNAMAVEAIKAQLMAALSEKKAKPDFLDMDKDGDKKEPMKKAIADKKAKK